MPSPYQDLANQSAAQYGIPSNIFSSLIAGESSWNPNAQASGSSAYGLTQMVRGTAQAMGVTDIKDPKQQLDGGARYLRQQYDKFGNWTDALAAYNQGPGGYNNASGQAYAAAALRRAGGLEGASGSGVGGGSAGASGSNDPTDSSYWTASGNASESTNAAIAGGDGTNSPLEWVKSQIGNVGFVVAGIVVLAVALVAASSKAQKFVVTAAKKAAGH